MIKVQGRPSSVVAPRVVIDPRPVPAAVNSQWAAASVLDTWAEGGGGTNSHVFDRSFTDPGALMGRVEDLNPLKSVASPDAIRGSVSHGVEHPSVTPTRQVPVTQRSAGATLDSVSERDADKDLAGELEYWLRLNGASRTA